MSLLSFEPGMHSAITSLNLQFVYVNVQGAVVSMKDLGLNMATMDLSVWIMHVVSMAVWNFFGFSPGNWTLYIVCGCKYKQEWLSLSVC